MKVILRELMASHSPLTGKYLANINQVSSRTTREDIKKLNEILSEHGSSINSVMGKGYELTIHHENKFLQYLDSELSDNAYENNNIPRSREDRIVYLIKRLLLSEGYVKLEDLADEIYVSKSTIQNDLKDVKKILSEYEISLEARPNYGLKIQGSELKLRFCMSEYVFDHSDERKDYIQEFYNSAFSKKELDAILSIILNQLNTHKITLSDIAINNLLIHIAIAYKRIQSGYKVNFYQTDVNQLVDKYEYRVAKQIVNEVEKSFQVEFPQSEIAYITMHLLGTKMLSKKNINNRVVEQVMDDETYQLVQISLNKIEREMNLGISDDQELIIGLGLHLKPAINRYKYDMNIRNPMLDDIKRNYPLAFEAGLVAALAIKDQIGTEMNENEIGYIALHIGAAIERKKLQSGPKRCLVVCASGFGTAQLIYYKLKARFYNEIEVVGTTEYYKLDEYNLDNIDFIVSSIPIPQELPVPVIEVNAILGDDDLNRIKNFVSEGEQGLHSLFQKELIFLNKQFQSKEEALSFMTNQLTVKGLVDSSFLESIYERERVAPTSFGNLVAIPHPINPKSNQTFLSVCTLDRPVIWHDKPVQFICILSVKKNSAENLQYLYDLLGNIIDSPSIVQQLVKVNSFEEFIGIISENFMMS
ncbi:BglG family transcription antiterminator [Salinibacillus aidingensis]